MTDKKLKLVRASDVVAQSVSWLMQNLVPLHTLTVVAGPSGIGKTTIVIGWLAQITRGEVEGTFQGKPANVLILSPEDDIARVTRPRLEAAGADLDRVHFISATREGPHGEIETIATFPTDMALLHEAIESVSPAVVMLDPIASLIDGNLDKREDVRAAFDALAAEIASRYNLAVILIAHNKKGADSVRGKISGSSAITDAARSVLAMDKDDDTGEVIVSVDKSSYSTAEGTNYSYTLTSVDVPVKGGSASVARADFKGKVEVSVADLHSRALANQQDAIEGTDAERWLRGYLETETAGGSAPTKTILTAARANGFTERTMQRAGQKLCDKGSSGFRGEWSWTLKDATPGGGGNHGNLGNHGNHGGNLDGPIDPKVAKVATENSKDAFVAKFCSTPPIGNLDGKDDNLACVVCGTELIHPESRRRMICAKPDSEHREASRLREVDA
jgi:hypothetical protein